MKLVRFECKKLFRSAGFRYLCAALLVLSFLSCILGSPYLPTDDGYIAKYEDNILYVIRVAERNLLEYEAFSDGDHYMIRYQKDVIERYSRLLENGVKPDETIGWNEYFNNNAGDLLTLIGAILAGVLLTMAEFDNGAEKLLHMTRKGRRSIYAKINVLALFSLLFTILMTAASLAGTALRFGFASPSSYLCSVEIFTYCPYGITIGGYLALSVLIKTANLFFLSLLAALTAVLVRSYLVSIALPLGILCGGYLISDIGSGKTLGLLNPYSLALTAPIFERYRSLNFIDRSIPMVLVSALLLILLCAAATLLISFSFLKGLGGSRIAGVEKNLVKFLVKAKDRILSIIPKARARRRGLLFSEAKKSFVKSHLILLCAVMICIKVGVCRENELKDYPAENLYRDICCSMSGELTDEKRALIDSELESASAVIARFDGMRIAVVSGMITNDEYQSYLSEYSAAQVREYAYTRLSLQCARIDSAAARGQDANIIYDTGWINFFESGADIVLYLFILLFFCGIYENEYKTGFYRIAAVSESGMGALHRSKLILAVIVSAVAFAVFSGIDIIFLLRSFPLPNASFSLASVRETIFSMPIWCAMASKYIIGCITAVILSAAVCMLSRFLKKMYLVIPTGLLIILLLML